MKVVRAQFSVVSIFLFLLVGSGNSNTDSGGHTSGAGPSKQCGNYFLCYVNNSLQHLNNLDPSFNSSLAFVKFLKGNWDSYDEACEYMLHMINITSDDEQDDTNDSCDTMWDTLSCWPKTAAGKESYIPCPHPHQGIDFTKNATRKCSENGTWAAKADYNGCLDAPHQVHEDNLRRLTAKTSILYVGYSLSTISLLISLFIFRYFRSLHCVRTLIHCNLMLTFVFRNILFIIFSCILREVHRRPWVCKLMMTFFHYFTTSSFFWMFVEGLYLYFMIVHAMRHNKIKFIYCIIIGWVAPIPFLILWIILKKLYEDTHCWLPVQLSAYDAVLYTPVITILCVNLIFFLNVLCVLICQLRRTEESLQYKKAFRASGILIPLLGINYLLFIVNPGSTPTSKEVFSYIIAFLQATQGLLLAILYCFMNSDVRAALAKKVRDHMETRSVTTKCTHGSPSLQKSSHEDYHLVSLRMARVSPGDQDSVSPQWDAEETLCIDLKEKNVQ
ncbi:corticotropin-releasing factor receptor 2-like [Octopus sinensis]|uniref:Corticotropin-releasing factor receptor 2-like n=1 Tax=Octopus sinensis TaxID=2607531 RepID=A0A6P7SS77_9MOLL|nr:corticotropin-releasing factor receptor 2-like [Octopus sinensis]